MILDAEVSRQLHRIPDMSWKTNMVGSKGQEAEGSFKKYPTSRVKANYDYAEK